MFDVLAYLIVNRGRVVAKEELLDVVWGNRFVSDSALTTRIKQARPAVGDDGQAQRVIKTANGRGYRFVAAVDEVTSAPARTPDSTTARPPESTADDRDATVDPVPATRYVVKTGPRSPTRSSAKGRTSH